MHYLLKDLENVYKPEVALNGICDFLMDGGSKDDIQVEHSPLPQETDWKKIFVRDLRIWFLGMKPYKTEIKIKYRQRYYGTMAKD